MKSKYCIIRLFNPKAEGLMYKCFKRILSGEGMLKDTLTIGGITHSTYIMRCFERKIKNY